MKKIIYKSLGWLYLLTLSALLLYKKVLAIEFDPEGEIQQATELPNPESGPEGVIIKYIQVLLAFAGLTTLIMIVFSGYGWMMAAGNEEKIAKAKKQLKGAIIGLVVILFSWMIVYFVFSRVEYLAS